MKPLLCFLAVILLFVSCRKENPSDLPTSASHEFFSSRTDMVRQIQSVIRQRYPGDQLQQISHVSYIDSKDKSYALVFYQSSKRKGNILMERIYKNGVLTATQSGTCEGTGCNCQVVTTISNSGEVKITCSCSTCTMLVTQSAPAQTN